jgi:hypothetical protein
LKNVYDPYSHTSKNMKLEQFYKIRELIYITDLFAIQLTLIRTAFTITLQTWTAKEKLLYLYSLSGAPG